MGRIGDIVRCFYDVLQSFNSSKNIDETIKFDVTLMAKSYLDDEITIVSSWDGDGKSTSLKSRQSNPKLLSDTETARLFNSWETHNIRPDTKICVDTSSPGANYVFTSDRQREKIKSAVIKPVFYDQRMLATLVVHCDKKYFIGGEPGDEKSVDGEKMYWERLIEVYEVPLAALLMIMDCAAKENQNYRPY